MVKNAISLLLLVFVLLSLLVIGCEGADDTSLQVFAYPPVDQQSGRTTSVMANVVQARFGVFEGEEYRLASVYQYDSVDDGALFLDELPYSDKTTYTYVLEGFGQTSVESTDECDINSEGSCSDGWVCRENRDKINVCVRVNSNGLIARGISAPTKYNRSDTQNLNIFFSKTMEFGTATLPNGDPSMFTTARYGHGSMLMPDGKVLFLGGESLMNNQAATFPIKAEIFDPSDFSIKELDVEGWSQGRSFFTMSELPDVAEVEEGEESMEKRFLIVGGNTIGGPVNEVYIGTYTGGDKPSVSLSLLAPPTGFPAMVRHTATELADGRILILGGMDATSAPQKTTWIFDPATNGMVAAGNLTHGRYFHTATAMPSGRVVVIGGVDANQNTIPYIEIFDPDTRTFSVADYTDTGLDEANTQYVNRAGHIAIPLAKYMITGEVAERDWPGARIAIYGGYRFTTGSTSKYYFNMPCGSDPNCASTVDVAFVDQEGLVKEFYQWNPNPGYKQALFSSPHPCVDARWIPLGDSLTTVLVVGGRQNNDNDYSNWAEILSFVGGDAGFSFDSVQFGSEDADTISTPFRATQTKQPRWGSALTPMSNGMIMVSGGRYMYTDERTATQTKSTLSTLEIFNPPSRNKWGNVFEVVSSF